MKSKRAVLAGMLSLLMVFSFINEGMTVQASTLPESDASSFEMVEISNEEIAPQTRRNTRQMLLKDHIAEKAIVLSGRRVHIAKMMTRFLTLIPVMHIW